MSDRPEATGVPAAGAMDVPHEQVMGGPGLHHWKQSTITDPSLERRENVFFAAIEMTRMPMVLSDPHLDDNPIVFANNAFLDLTGYETDEIVGRNCRFLQGPHSDRETVARLREAVTRREAVSLEIINYKRDGTPFWNAVFMGPVFDPAGEILYFFASQLDVTRRRESEEGLRQAQKMESIGQLTAGLAHDFNNLLQVIGGGLEMMTRRRLDEGAFARHHGAATLAAERASKLTGQLLAFASRSRLEPRRVNLSDLVSSFAELLDSSVGSTVDLQLHLRRRLPDVLVDPTHFEMALINIVVNARDAMPEGGSITVATSVHQADADRAGADRAGADRAGATTAPGTPHEAYIRLDVIDEGTGMAPDVLARATEPFFSTKRRGQGTGLGLAMAHGFAQQSGGRLAIDSAPGKGSTVSIFFPVATPLRDEDRGADTPQAPGAAMARLILVVEDNPEIADLARDVLEEAGYRVIVTHDADEALAQFERVQAAGGIDLLFSDVVMPGSRNGLELAEVVRGRDPGIPILLTTGYNDQMALDGPQPVALDVLGKPYRRSELLERVQNALRVGARTGPGRTLSDFGVATS